MEKTFNKIVLSKTEPSVEDLWMRLTPNETNGIGHSLWWFTSQGWKKLFDFDTRYSINTDFSYEASKKPFDSDSTYSPETGIVDMTNTYSLYDGSRELGDNANLVTEGGLKVHVDAINKEINSIKQRLTKVETNLNNEISDRENADGGLSERIDAISTRLSTITETLTSISSNINMLESRISNLES